MELTDKLHAPAAILPGKNTGTQSTGDWVVPKAGLNVLEKRKILCPCRASYPGSSSP